MLDAMEFYRSFKESVVENRIHKDGKTFFDIYRHDSAFTDLVNKKLIHEIVRNSGLTVQHEYFRIDTVGWDGKYLLLDEKRAKEVGLNRHLWDLKIAVEHENDKKDWLDELIKLVHIRCPLKVIIGYNYCDQRDEPEREKLAYAAECMRMVKAFHATEEEEYLVILGNGVPKDTKAALYTSFDYRGYLYNHIERQFERIMQNNGVNSILTKAI